LMQIKAAMRLMILVSLLMPPVAVHPEAAV
jgi:uncharacterized membrane protein YqaE (UPF0057 family)